MFIFHDNLLIKNNIKQFSQKIKKSRKYKNINNIDDKNNPLKNEIPKNRKDILEMISKNEDNIDKGDSYINNKNRLTTDNSNNYINKNEIIRTNKLRKKKKKKKIKKSIVKSFPKNKNINLLNAELIAKEQKIENKIINDNEINSLNYEKARKKDKRTYLQYYFSLLRTKHILIFTFLQFRDYNSQSIKIYIFFLTFAIDYLINAMFYSDDTMHKINKDKGTFDITYQQPIMVYSMLISTILNTLI